MSNLARSAMGARIAKLPPPELLPIVDDDEEEEAADSLAHLPPGGGMGPPAMQVTSSLERPAHNRRRKTKKEPNPEYSPISGSGYFKEAAQVSVPSRQLDVRAYYSPPANNEKGTVMVCHHGAGLNGLAFACMAKEIEDLTKAECGVLALDARRHGKTTSTLDPEPPSLSIEVLVQDLVDTLKTIFPDPAKAPTLLLVGHSMGGSVVVFACQKLLDLKYKICGTAVLDVVEGTALDALPHMNNILNTFPDGFDSVEEAVEWHVNTKTVRNPNSARVSVPGIIKPSESTSPGIPPFVWRTPLRLTAPYWRSWFEGLSKNFLAVRSARILILAGTDRLDKELMIGQMQGKFQLEVVNGVGHHLHEDDPTKLAETLVDFWRRNDRLIAGIKRVGDL